ncbi:hypothetical protein SAMN04487846_1055 [Microbacterium sp. cf046]|uniref:hypothetical protein n=1 Tax=Microbacterium sp. cf046 TaxID=1761803 RepID=UPI0008E5976D|nr:hypothetical protein [Microbacterium sp. cf046]SFR94933.1 hypothetical protein SAMN04487846_1055 [Microbacterium sp. cf046]
MAAYFVPALDLLPYWPHDLLAPSDVPMLGRLGQYAGVTEFELVEYEGELGVVGTLALWDELTLDLPLVDGLQLVLGQPGPHLTALPFELSFGAPTTEVTGGPAEVALDKFLKGRQGPYELVLPAVDIGLRFDPEHLRPMRPKDAGDLRKGFEIDPTRTATQLNFRGAVAINTDTGIRMEAPGDLDLPYCQIGSTGIVITAQDLVMRFSDDQPFPEGIDPEAFDLDPDWKGVFLGRVQVFNLNTLVEWLPERLDLEKWFIGRGGVTGKATAILDLAPDMSAQDFAVRSFRFAFQQNALLEGLIQLAVKLPYFDDKVAYLDLAITNEPTLDFPESMGFMGAIAGVQPPGGSEAPRQDELIALPADPILRVGVTRLGVRAKPDRGRVRNDEPPETRFWDLLIDGRVEIGPASTVAASLFGGEFTELILQVSPRFDFVLPSGLWLAMNEAARTKLAAFPVTISRVGFGSQDAEKWVGLDAAVDFGKGIGPAASVKGLRVFYGGPPGTHISFEGIGLKLDRAGFAFEGFVSMVTGADPGGIADPGDRIFRGDVKLAVAAGVGVTLEGSVLFGTKAGTRFGYVALDAEFGSGIPVFSSVSWFGAALLAGVNVTPDKSLTGDQGDDFNWYQHWYAPSPGPHSVINARKWVPAEDGWAAGAGVTLGSSDGKAWSLRALLAVVAPGPVIIVEGRLRVLQTREPHSGPPRSTTIRGLMVLDFDQGDFLLALEVDYKLPESGLLMDVHAAGEVFYGHRPGDWHLAIGWPEPISRRVRAKALKLLEWDAYLVITGRDLELAERTFPGTALAVGYRTGIDKRGKWGPIKGVLAVWIAGDVAISFRPFYILAELSLHGEASIKVFGIGFELMLDALLALEAPVDGDDEYFGGKVRIKLGLPWPLPDIKKDIPFEWGDASGMPPPITPLVDGASVSPGYSIVGERLYERETGAVSGISMPLDGRVSIAFQRPMRSTWAGAPTPVDVARPDRVGDLYYRYTLLDVRVQVTPSAGSPHDATEDLFGQWTLGPGDVDGPQAESLVLWGLTPFPAAGNLAWPGRTERRSWADLLFETYTRWPCGTLPPVERCVDFGIPPLGVYDPELRYRPEPAFGAVVFRAWPGVDDQEDGLRGERVQVPLAIIGAGGGAPGQALRLARTTFLGGEDGGDGAQATLGPVDGVTVAGASIDLPPSVRAHGRIEHNKDLTFLIVIGLRGDEVVASAIADGPDFEITSDAKPFTRVILRLQPRGGPSRKGEDFHTLTKFCYTTAAALANDAEVHAQRSRWQHVMGPLTIDQPETDAAPFGTHLVHEPHAAYRIELDIRTESAAALDDPWTDLGVATEALTVSTAGAPADLSPYVHSVAPGDGARPFYADYDLRILYNQPYVEAMYLRAGGRLTADLFTSGGQHVEPEITRGRTLTPAITGEVGILIDRLDASECIVVDLDTIAGYDVTTYRTRLATATAYEVRVSGGGLPDPVHRWSFVTSRYRTFAEHIADARATPWHERLAAGIDWAAVAAGLAPAVDRGLEDQAWRSIWQGAFGFPIRTLPTRPDITVLWTEGAAFEARALAIASPEPLFADERTMLVLTRKKTTMVLTPAGPQPTVAWVEVPHRLVRSLDGTRALLVGTDLAGQPVPLTAGACRLTATYRLAGIPGLPDLSRQGDDADETATWAFTLPDTPSPIVDPEA